MKESGGNNKLSKNEQEIVAEYYEYALQCLSDHGLDVEEYHGEICIKLCKIVQSIGVVDNMNSKYHSRIHTEVHRMLEKSIERNIEILTSDIPEASYRIDWDNVSMLKDLREVLEVGFTERELSVLKMSMSDIPQTVIAKELGISVNRVYQIMTHALRKLRHPSRSRVLKSYI